MFPNIRHLHEWPFIKTHNGRMEGSWCYDAKDFDITEETWSHACDCINRISVALQLADYHTEKLDGNPGITVFYKSDFVEVDVPLSIEDFENPDFKEVDQIANAIFSDYKHKGFSRSGGLIEKTQRPISVSFIRPFNLDESRAKDIADGQSRYRDAVAWHNIKDQPL